MASELERLQSEEEGCIPTRSMPEPRSLISTNNNVREMHNFRFLQTSFLRYSVAPEDILKVHSAETAELRTFEAAVLAFLNLSIGALLLNSQHTQESPGWLTRPSHAF